MAPVQIEHRTIPGGPAGDIPITILHPEGATGTLPAVLYTHGGGWILGNFGTHQRLVRELVQQTGAVFVFVNYTPSPEAHYPVAIEQAYAVLMWVSEHGEELGIDTTRLAVAGESVGGNMTAAVTMLAKERGGPALCYQALLYPVTNAAFGTETYAQFADGPWLTRKAREWFWDAYAPDPTVRAEPTASPLRASLEQLAGLPPALVITDEADVLRDEGEAYGRKLRRLHSCVIPSGACPERAQRVEWVEGSTIGGLSAGAKLPVIQSAVNWAARTFRRLLSSHPAGAAPAFRLLRTLTRESLRQRPVCISHVGMMMTVPLTTRWHRPRLHHPCRVGQH